MPDEKILSKHIARNYQALHKQGWSPFPIDPENSAENRSKKPAAKHYSAKATMEFNRNLVQDGEKKREKSDLRAKYPTRSASQGLTPPSAAGGKQKALY